MDLRSDCSYLEIFEGGITRDVREKLVELLDIIIQPGQKTLGDIADYLIRNGVTVQEWISVKDRLPDKDGWYIVTACDEGCSCGDGIWYDTVVIEAEYYKGEWSWNENGIEYDITDLVTHWQPMPQPPKGE